MEALRVKRTKKPECFFSYKGPMSHKARVSRMAPSLAGYVSLHGPSIPPRQVPLPPSQTPAIIPGFRSLGTSPGLCVLLPLAGQWFLLISQLTHYPLFDSLVLPTLVTSFLNWSVYFLDRMQLIEQRTLLPRGNFLAIPW